MQAIEEEHGLKSEEFWRLGEGPSEYQELNVQYVEILRGHLVSTFIEFGEDKLATLLEADETAFERLANERWERLSEFGPSTPSTAADELRLTYEKESVKAADGGAFYAACALLGAALEALLLRECYRNHEAVTKAREDLPASKRPRQSDPSRWSLSELVSIATAAGWPPQVAVGINTLIDMSRWSHLLREFRNLLHPGRQLRILGAGTRLAQAEYEDARAVYNFVKSTL